MTTHKQCLDQWQLTSGAAKWPADHGHSWQHSAVLSGHPRPWRPAGKDHDPTTSQPCQPVVPRIYLQQKKSLMYPLATRKVMHSSFCVSSKSLSSWLVTLKGHCFLQSLFLAPVPYQPPSEAESAPRHPSVLLDPSSLPAGRIPRTSLVN